MSPVPLPAELHPASGPVASRGAPRVSVVILTKDGGELLRKVVASVLDQELPEPFELLLVDSGSRDGVPRELAATRAIRLVQVPPASFNHGATRNAAIEEATGEIVALLVQDAEPADRGWLAALVAALDEDPLAAGAYARQRPRPEHPGWVKDAVSRHVAGLPDGRVQTLSATDWERATPGERLAAITFDNVSSVIRRSAWRAHPFARLPFGEDVEWARRVLLAGARILYAPRAQVIHSHDRGAMYELRRAYVCHRLLRELVGLVLVPDGRTLLSGAASTARANAARARLEGRVAWRAAATGAASVLGQYLGARPTRWRDRWLGRGV